MTTELEEFGPVFIGPVGKYVNPHTGLLKEEYVIFYHNPGDDYAVNYWEISVEARKKALNILSNRENLWTKVILYTDGDVVQDIKVVED